MTERLLQFIWQFQYYNKMELQLVNGEPLQIIHPGTYNSNQGPDFSQARIKIGHTVFAGTIELHVRSTDWQKHNHDTDKNYNNVILHVVWFNEAGKRKDIPVLELHNRVPVLLLQKYEQWMIQPVSIPCNQQLIEVNDLIWTSWKDRLLAERLLRKSHSIQQYLLQNNQHWEETFWWLLARHFGASVNAMAFEEIAKSIPLKVMAKSQTQIHQLEALLFGQAGLLENKFDEEYPNLLRAEYNFLKTKYRLHKIAQPIFFLRMRPMNFPTIRLAQLAMTIHRSTHLFSQIKEIDSLETVKKLFDITANDYWHYHYVFDESTSCMPKKVGAQLFNSIVINVLSPMLFTYAKLKDEPLLKNKAFRWMQETHAEKNTITNIFLQLGMISKNACDSQSFIELKTEYCDNKRCLDCSVGNALLKNATIV
ncbi:MAG: DUF2851 family protein [Chitinophagaceae bacterium]